MNKEKAVEISNLTYRYPDGNLALQNVNLSIFAGESVAIIGHNGAGKSTLLLHLNGILKENGAVKIFGKPVNGENLKGIRRMVGMVFQDPDDQLFCPTVYDDVVFGPINMGMNDKEAKERVTDVLGRIGLSGFEKRSAHHMSAGEKKRAAIATVLSMEPKILIFDEPTSNLDPKMRRVLIDLIKSFPETKIIVSHDLPIALELCQRIVILEKGRVVEDGSVKDILGKREVLERYEIDPSYHCQFCDMFKS